MFFISFLVETEDPSPRWGPGALMRASCARALPRGGWEGWSGHRRSSPGPRPKASRLTGSPQRAPLAQERSHTGGDMLGLSMELSGKNKTDPTCFCLPV